MLNFAKVSSSIIYLDLSVLPTMADSSIHSLGEETRNLQISSPATTEAPQRPAIMRLPLELRRMIYRRVFSFTFTKRRDRGALDIIYYQNHQKGCVDRPFLFFHINKQIHAEICDFLPPIPACIRISAQGMLFDTLGLASAAAQGFHHERDFGKVSHILVKIWPPHQERPVEMLYIWEYVRRLRDLLRKCQRIQKLTLHFQNKRPFHWDTNSLLTVCRRVFGEDTMSIFIRGCDVMTVLELFAVLTNVKDAQVVLPKSGSKSWYPTKSDIRTEEIKKIMMGIHGPANGPSYVEQFDYKVIENFLNLCSHQMPLDTLLSQFSRMDKRKFDGRWENSPRWHIEEAEYDESRMGKAETSKGPWFQAKPGDRHMRRWFYSPYEYDRPLWTWLADRSWIEDQQHLYKIINCFMQESFGN